MMSEVGKEIFKALPALDLSTQDFILTKDGAKGMAQATTLTSTINLAQSLNGGPSKICFNKDAKFYTPAFLDQACAPTSAADDAFLQLIFQKKTVESSNSRHQLFRPKPSNNYCSICKESFADYLKHVEHPVHQKKLADSSCDGYISDLCDLVRKRARREEVSVQFGMISGSSRKMLKKDDSLEPSQRQISDDCSQSTTIFQYKTMMVRTIN